MFVARIHTRRYIPAAAPRAASGRARRGSFECLLADAGLDAEKSHRLAYEELEIAALIPPTAGRPTAKPAADPYRRWMRELFGSGAAQAIYGQRWQVETVHSMIKPNQGSTLWAMTSQTRERGLLLRIITQCHPRQTPAERRDRAALRPRSGSSHH